MGVDKIILRAFLSTLAAIFTLIAFMFLALVAFFPSTMMEISYDMGMESSSIRYAERAYKTSEDVYYIAYATEVAIEEEKQGKILSCGEKFIAHEDFADYCEKKGENQEGYKQFIYAQVCLSKYEAGDAEGAIALAESSLQEGRFTRGNALAAVLVKSLEKEDGAAQQRILQILEGLTVVEEDQAYLNDAKNLLK